MSHSDHLFVHRDAKPEVAVDALWPGVVTGGNPHTVTMNGYESADGTLLMGTWMSTPGVWRVHYQDWEYCHFLEGRCIITPDGGQPIELRAGDTFVVEPGLKGTWEVVETVRKYYVFRLYGQAERGADHG